VDLSLNAEDIYKKLRSRRSYHFAYYWVRKAKHMTDLDWRSAVLEL